MAFFENWEMLLAKGLRKKSSPPSNALPHWCKKKTCLGALLPGTIKFWRANTVDKSLEGMSYFYDVKSFYKE